jgi:hypothetical protein
MTIRTAELKTRAPGADAPDVYMKESGNATTWVTTPTMARWQEAEILRRLFLGIESWEVGKSGSEEVGK